MDGLQVNMDGLQVDNRGMIHVPPRDPNNSNAELQPSTASSPPSPSRILWGLSVLAYTIMIVAITFVITGAAFGGALGGVIANQKSDS